MNKFTITAFFTVCSVLFNAYADNMDAKAGSSKSMKYKEMSGLELDKIMNDKKEKENYFVLDVREPPEYAEGHVRYAVNISVGELEKRLGEISDLKDKKVVTICRSGSRSAQAAKILKKHGFTDVFNAKGMSQYKYASVTKTPNIRGKDLAKAAENNSYFIIDAREEKDFNEGHLNGAVNITLDTLNAKINTLPKGKPIAVYCYSGNRSFELANRLVSAGYNAVSSLDGSAEYKFPFVK